MNNSDSENMAILLLYQLKEPDGNKYLDIPNHRIVAGWKRDLLLSLLELVITNASMENINKKFAITTLLDDIDKMCIERYEAEGLDDYTRAFYLKENPRLTGLEQSVIDFVRELKSLSIELIAQDGSDRKTNTLIFTEVSYDEAKRSLRTVFDSSFTQSVIIEVLDMQLQSEYIN